MSDTRTEIADFISAVTPFEDIEREHIADVLEWIGSGAEIFRVEKPATPPKHLVCYSVLVDVSEKKILLLDHKKALKMLPSGGHVDKGEMPLETAKRELIEELGIEPEPLFPSEAPFFVTVMETVGLTAGHTDVDLWYVFSGDSRQAIDDDTEEFKREFDGFHWLGFDEILTAPIEQLDAHMHRFVRKLQTAL